MRGGEQPQRRHHPSAHKRADQPSTWQDHMNGDWNNASNEVSYVKETQPLSSRRKSNHAFASIQNQLHGVDCQNLDEANRLKDNEQLMMTTMLSFYMLKGRPRATGEGRSQSSPSTPHHMTEDCHTNAACCVGSLMMNNNLRDQGKDEDSSSQSANEEDNQRGQGPSSNNKDPKTAQ